MDDLQLQYELFQNKLAVIEAMRRGAESVDVFAGQTLGPTSFDRIDYPFVNILPEQTAYQSGNEWEHTVRFNVAFQRGRREDDYLIQMMHVFEAIKAINDELSGVNCVISYLPVLIEDFAGETNGNLIVMFSTQFRVRTLVDLADV